jgi:radical SAM/Cys-rich protein
MAWQTMEALLTLIPSLGCRIVDITGGAPELHPRLRDFVNALKGCGTHVMVRTNLTVLMEDGMEDLPGLMADNRVELIASLPCYLEEEVAEQRGEGVFQGSIQALRILNEVGYGRSLPLSLVYNPLGAFLPPPQGILEEKYRTELSNAHGVVFTKLLTITNMPAGRFLEDLRDKGSHEEYIDLLRRSFNPETTDSLMCRSQINVGWDGTICDCDFNQALGRETGFSLDGDLDPRVLSRRRIRTGDHCFGCTAGAGSSCGGALTG